MKLRTQALSLLVLAVFGLFLAGCKDGGNETPKEKIELGKLKKEWSIVSATLDGNVKTADFTGMTLTISGTYSSASNAEYDYAVAGTTPDPSPWPKPGDTDGTWSFVAVESGLIKRDPGSIDELSMIYSITDDQLKITFDLDSDTGWPGGKTSSVNGSWEFIFE